MTEIIFRHGRISWMSTLTPQIKATSKSSVLIAVDKFHALYDPQDSSVKDLPNVAYRQVSCAGKWSARSTKETVEGWMSQQDNCKRDGSGNQDTHSSWSGTN
jgi:hypothetical protein